jgi:hypothetical protein
MAPQVLSWRLAAFFPLPSLAVDARGTISLALLMTGWQGALEVVAFGLGAVRRSI